MSNERRTHSFIQKRKWSNAGQNIIFIHTPRAFACVCKLDGYKNQIVQLQERNY